MITGNIRKMAMARQDPPYPWPTVRRELSGFPAREEPAFGAPIR